MEKILAKQASYSQGYSLLEILIALAIIGIVAAGSMKFVGEIVEQRRIVNLQIAKSRIINQMETALKDPRNIQSALEYLTGANRVNNLNFARCLDPSDMCESGYTDPATMKPMDYHMFGGFDRIQLNGNWSKEGNPNCATPTAESCPFESKVYFWFTCNRDRSAPALPVTSGCRGPSHVNLVFTLAPTDLEVQKNWNVEFYYPERPPSQTTPVSDPARYAVRISSKDAASAAQSCPSDQYIDGLDPSGRIICKCLSHKQQKDAGGADLKDSLGRPVCADIRCLDNEIFIGFDTDSNGEWKPVCVNAFDPRHCYDINILSETECHEGYWLTSVNIGACEIPDAANKKKKAGADIPEIQCANDSARCCRGRF